MKMMRISVLRNCLDFSLMALHEIYLSPNLMGCFQCIVEYGGMTSGFG